jgi:hypothetical protein
VGVRAAFPLPGVGEGLDVGTAVPCRSAGATFWAVAVAALPEDVVAGRTRDVLCSDDACGALLAVGVPPACGSMGKRPDRRKASPITAAIALATRNVRWTEDTPDRRRRGRFASARCSPWPWRSGRSCK